MDYNSIDNIEAALEALLFSSGEPITEERICSCLGIDFDELTDAELKLSDSLSSPQRGIELIHLNNKIGLVSKSIYADSICNVLETRKPAALSNAAMETLSVIAYRQPVTKLYIEQVRGVESGYSINALLEKGFIEVVDRLDVPGRPMVYGTTDKFLRIFGLSSLKDLPPVPEPENKEPIPKKSE